MQVTQDPGKDTLFIREILVALKSPPVGDDAVLYKIYPVVQNGKITGYQVL